MSTDNLQDIMTAWSKGVPCLLSLLQEGEEEDGKEEEEEADSGLGEEEEELEVDVGDNEEPFDVQNEDGDQDEALEQNAAGYNEELTHVTLMYEVGSRPEEAKVGLDETLDLDSSSRNLDKDERLVDEATERVRREAENRRDREDILNFVREQEEAKIQSWVTQRTTIDKEGEEEIYKDYRSPFIFR